MDTPKFTKMFNYIGFSTHILRPCLDNYQYPVGVIDVQLNKGRLIIKGTHQQHMDIAEEEIREEYEKRWKEKRERASPASNASKNKDPSGQTTVSLPPPGHDMSSETPRKEETAKHSKRAAIVEGVVRSVDKKDDSVHRDVVTLSTDSSSTGNVKKTPRTEEHGKESSIDLSKFSVEIRHRAFEQFHAQNPGGARMRIDNNSVTFEDPRKATFMEEMRQILQSCNNQDDSGKEKAESGTESPHLHALSLRFSDISPETLEHLSEQITLKKSGPSCILHRNLFVAFGHDGAGVLQLYNSVLDELKKEGLVPADVTTPEMNPDSFSQDVHTTSFYIGGNDDQMEFIWEKVESGCLKVSRSVDVEKRPSDEGYSVIVLTGPTPTVSSAYLDLVRLFEGQFGRYGCEAHKILHAQMVVELTAHQNKRNNDKQQEMMDTENVKQNGEMEQH